ncbi:MAG: antibiotic biosynthesis monooxygenase [Rhodobacteraceae bacterium]|nr:antibiotic biosynthesis monooxygenase [Paracoccaceae bacterium]
MIIRVFRAQIHPDRAGEFERFLRETALPLVRAQEGCLSVTAGLPLPGGPAEFCIVMVWRDLDALRAFVGEDWQHPHVLPEEEGLVVARELSHYRGIDSIVI